MACGVSALQPRSLQPSSCPFVYIQNCHRFCLPAILSAPSSCPRWAFSKASPMRLFIPILFSSRTDKFPFFRFSSPTFPHLLVGQQAQASTATTLAQLAAALKPAVVQATQSGQPLRLQVLPLAATQPAAGSIAAAAPDAPVVSESAGDGSDTDADDGEGAWVLIKKEAAAGPSTTTTTTTMVQPSAPPAQISEEPAQTTATAVVPQQDTAAAAAAQTNGDLTEEQRKVLRQQRREAERAAIREARAAAREATKAEMQQQRQPQPQPAARVAKLTKDPAELEYALEKARLEGALAVSVQAQKRAMSILQQARADVRTATEATRSLRQQLRQLRHTRDARRAEAKSEALAQDQAQGQAEPTADVPQSTTPAAAGVGAAAAAAAEATAEKKAPVSRSTSADEAKAADPAVTLPAELEDAFKPGQVVLLRSQVSGHNLRAMENAEVNGLGAQGARARWVVVARKGSAVQFANVRLLHNEDGQVAEGAASTLLGYLRISHHRKLDAKGTGGSRTWLTVVPGPDGLSFALESRYHHPKPEEDGLPCFVAVREDGTAKHPVQSYTSADVDRFTVTKLDAISAELLHKLQAARGAKDGPRCKRHSEQDADEPQQRQGEPEPKERDHGYRHHQHLGGHHHRHHHLRHFGGHGHFHHHRHGWRWGQQPAEDQQGEDMPQAQRLARCVQRLMQKPEEAVRQRLMKIQQREQKVQAALEARASAAAQEAAPAAAATSSTSSDDEEEATWLTHMSTERLQQRLDRLQARRAAVSQVMAERKIAAAAEPAAAAAKPAVKPATAATARPTAATSTTATTKAPAGMTELKVREAQPRHAPQSAEVQRTKTSVDFPELNLHVGRQIFLQSALTSKFLTADKSGTLLQSLAPSTFVVEPSEAGCVRLRHVDTNGYLRIVTGGVDCKGNGGPWTRLRPLATNVHSGKPSFVLMSRQFPRPAFVGVTQQDGFVDPHGVGSEEDALDAVQCWFVAVDPTF